MSIVLENLELVDVYKYGNGGEPICGAVEFLYELLADRPAGANISHRAMPSLEVHQHFVESRPYWKWNLISNGCEWVGATYITHHNEIGIFILSHYRGKGYAYLALCKVLSSINPQPAIPSVRRGVFLANIAPGNEVSIKLFERLGFRHIQNTYALEDA